MRTKNNLLDRDEKVIQLVALPEIARNSWDRIQPKYTMLDNDSIPYYTVGAALTDKGNVYALLYDGNKGYFIDDPMYGKFEVMARQIDRALGGDAI